MNRQHWFRFAWGLTAGLLAAGWVCADAGLGVLEDITRLHDYVSKRESSGAEDLESNADARPIPAGETLVLGELEGPGIISHIWTTVGSVDPFHGRSLVLRIYWDHNEYPSVEAPLGDFFGVGHGAGIDFTSQPVQVSSHGRSRNCYWHMPFREHAKVTVTNESEEYDTGSFYYYLNWQQYEELPEDIHYFHAQYRQETPAKPEDYVILETEGRGHYVGTVQSVQKSEIGWFGEGDDRFYIDGEDYPSIRGTGTEDYFGDAWGFRAFDTPYHGVSLWEGYFPGDRVTAYRWHLTDPITFRESLRVEIQTRGSVFDESGEHYGQFNKRDDWVSTVAFWYQDEPIELTAGIAPVEERTPPYRVMPASEILVGAEPEEGLDTSGPAVEYAPGHSDTEITFEFELDEPGLYQVNAIIMHSVFSGVYQPYLNGEPLGDAMDMNMTGADPLWVRFDLHELDAGTHTLSFAGVSESPNRRTKAPDFRAFGMNYLILLRMEDFDGYQGALNRILGDD